MRYSEVKKSVTIAPFDSGDGKLHMSEQIQSVKYRCAKCRHRLNGDEAACTHCHWKVDLRLAAEMAQIHLRKRNDYYNKNQRFKSIRMVVLALLAGLIVLLVLMLMNSAVH